MNIRNHLVGIDRQLGLNEVLSPQISGGTD